MNSDLTKLSYYYIEIDGIDKTGKDTLWHYIDYMSGRKYVINSRGIISQVAYSCLYDRKYTYMPTVSNYNNTLIVYLTADEDDWNIRCKITNEPKIDYKSNINAFNDAKDFIKNTTHVNVLEFNTSHMTPYEIAKAVCKRMDELNEECNSFISK